MNGFQEVAAGCYWLFILLSLQYASPQQSYSSYTKGGADSHLCGWGSAYSIALVCWAAGDCGVVGDTQETGLDVWATACGIIQAGQDAEAAEAWEWRENWKKKRLFQSMRHMKLQSVLCFFHLIT